MPLTNLHELIFSLAIKPTNSLQQTEILFVQEIYFILKVLDKVICILLSNARFLF